MIIGNGGAIFVGAVVVDDVLKSLPIADCKVPELLRELVINLSALPPIPKNNVAE